MPNYFPQTFREIVASVSIVVGFIFSFISLFKIQGEFLREHLLRIAAIFSLLGLSLFADSAYTYFASVFIIATAVTQLEFLQTLAAIIRGNKEYFDFMAKLATRSQAEIAKDLERKVEEIEQAQENQDLVEVEQKQIDTCDIDSRINDKSESQSSNGSTNLVYGETDKLDHQPISDKPIKCIKDQKTNMTYNLSPVELALMVEEYTFKLLEQKYNTIIYRHVSVKGTNLEFDGFMRKDSTTIIFEIKTVRNGILPLSILHKNLSKLILGIKNNIQGFVILRFILVGNFTLSQRYKIEESKKDINNWGIGLEFDFYTFEEVGLKDIISVHRRRKENN